jgi:LPXTG-site transpeptidase (sortase) family protein
MTMSRKEVRRREKAVARSRVYRWLAAALIIIGLGILSFTVFQRMMVNYQQAKLRDAYEATAGFVHLERTPETIIIEEWQPMRLIIPAINVDLVAVGGGDVFDKALLDIGPTHFQMSDLPSTEGGNVAFAGHRAGRWNFFLDIDQLEEGDEIYLDVSGYRFIYHVEWVKVFDKYDWGPINTTEYPAITLQTCEPKHVSNPDYRLMARGVLERVVNVPVEAPEAN